MANPLHLEILLKGITVWNKWRSENRGVNPDLSGSDLSGLNLSSGEFHFANFSNAICIKTDFLGAILNSSCFTEANCSNANFSGSNLIQSDCSNANFNDAILKYCELIESKWISTNLENANFHKSNLSEADFTNANMKNCNITYSILVDSILDNAQIDGAFVYGSSVWNVKSEKLSQNSLIITRPFEFKNFEREPVITVDNLEVAQFIHMLIKNKKLRDILDTIATKAVLILGRFIRMDVLEAIRDLLKSRDYIPIIFNFDKPDSKDLLETVHILAKLSRFVIADITSPSAVPIELETLIPDSTSVPFVPIIEGDEKEFDNFTKFKNLNQVLKIYRYSNIIELKSNFDEKIIIPAELALKKLRENQKDPFKK